MHMLHVYSRMHIERIAHTFYDNITIAGICSEVDWQFEKIIENFHQSQSRHISIFNFVGLAVPERLRLIRKTIKTKPKKW